MEKEQIKKRLTSLMMAITMISTVSCEEKSDTTFSTKDGKKDLKNYQDFLDYYNIDYKKCTATSEDDIVYIEERKIEKHTLEQGETMESICEKYNMTKKEFSSINLISENCPLREGREYKIYKTNVYSFKLEQLDENGKYTYYTIVEGSTLWGIAQANNTTIEELLEINPNIKDPNNIQIGETIKIPRNKEKTLKK